MEARAIQASLTKIYVKKTPAFRVLLPNKRDELVTNLILQQLEHKNKVNAEISANDILGQRIVSPLLEYRYKLMHFGDLVTEMIELCQ